MIESEEDQIKLHNEYKKLHSNFIFTKKEENS